MNFLQERTGRIFAYRSPVDMRKGFRQGRRHAAVP